MVFVTHCFDMTSHAERAVLALGGLSQDFGLR